LIELAEALKADFRESRALYCTTTVRGKSATPNPSTYVIPLADKCSCITGIHVIHDDQKTGSILFFSRFQMGPVFQRGDERVSLTLYAIHFGVMSESMQRSHIALIIRPINKAKNIFPGQ
jgi:hypothetical protein